MNKSMRFLLVLILAIIGQVNMWGANSSTPTDVGNYINLKDGTYSGDAKTIAEPTSEGGYKVGYIKNNSSSAMTSTLQSKPTTASAWRFTTTQEES